MKAEVRKKLKNILPEGTVLLPIPEGKKGPRIRNWNQKRFRSTQSTKYQEQLSKAGNTGVLLGSASGGLCSIDLDDDEQARKFYSLNPALQDSLTTTAKRGYNVWVKIKGHYPKTKKFHWGEWRADGSQTVIAGVHPDGMEYRFMNEAPPVCMRFNEINFPEGTSFEGVTKGGNTILSSMTIELAEQSGAAAKENIQRLWDKFIAPKFNPIAGERNHNLVQTGSYAFYNSSPEIAFELTMMVYDKAAALWNDSREQHEHEARHLLTSMENGYRESLPSSFYQVWDDLNEREQYGFRICRSLQYFGKGKFFLSMRELQERLGLPSHGLAGKLIERYKQYGVVRCIKKGNRKLAAEFRWILKAEGFSSKPEVEIESNIMRVPCPDDLCPDCWENGVMTKLTTPWPCSHLPAKPDPYPWVIFLPVENPSECAG